MKKIIGTLFFISLVTLFVWVTYFLYQKSKAPLVVYETVQAVTTDIVVKTVATGNIRPREEIDLKSQVSGVLDKIYVEAGDRVEKGQLVARIDLIPNVEQLRSAESNVEKAQLNYANEKRDVERQRQLYKKSLISEFEFNRHQLEYDLAKEALQASKDAVDLIKEGASKSSGQVSNLVHTTTDGVVLNMPVEVGDFIIESNTFNAGTTIAEIANMDDMIFEGRIDESEVGKLKEGMPLSLSIGALNEQIFDAILEFIAPKGFDDQGTIKFEVRAAITLQESTFLRAGYSANADIVLAKKEQVLAVNEGDLLIEDDNTYIEEQVGEQVFEKKQIEVGLSDGIYIEVLNGLDEDTVYKKKY